MKSQVLTSVALLAIGAAADSFWVNEPDTAIDLAIPNLEVGQLPDLEDMIGLPDFDWAARNYLPTENYTYYRNGAAGEWSYRANLEIFSKFHMRPRVFVDITNIENTMPTSILGHNFSAPFFISPAAYAGFGHPEAELNLVRAAGAQNILYTASYAATKTIEEIGEAKLEDQVIFRQVYLTSNDTQTQIDFDRAKAAGAKAIVFTVDTPADANRHRAERFGVGTAQFSYTLLTWDYYKKIQQMTDLPIIPKGLGTVDDVKLAIEHGLPAVWLSNHGGRQLDTAQTTLETALEIYREDPDIFNQIEIYADGGIRYGTDALKLLALGVKAVGMGRPFMYSNVFGQEGVEKAIEIMKKELAADAANVGIGDLSRIDSSYVNWNSPWYCNR